MVDWFGSVAQGMFNLGYPGIVIALVIEGLGLPFPGDAVMVVYGFAAGEGRFRLPGVILCAIIGYLIGSIAGYAGSYLYGPQLGGWVNRLPWFNQRRMMRTTRLVDRYGALLLVPGRFIPGMRSVSAYVAGFSRMDPRPYLGYTVIGTILWCSAWAGAGYVFGENAEAMLHALQTSFAWVAGVCVLIVIAIWIIRRQSAA